MSDKPPVFWANYMGMHSTENIAKDWVPRAEWCDIRAYVRLDTHEAVLKERDELKASMWSWEVAKEIEILAKCERDWNGLKAALAEAKAIISGKTFSYPPDYEEMKAEVERYKRLYEDYSSEVEELQHERKAMEDHSAFLQAEIKTQQDCYRTCGELRAEVERLKERIDILSKGWPAGDILRLEAEAASLRIMAELDNELATACEELLQAEGEKNAKRVTEIDGVKYYPIGGNFAKNRLLHQIESILVERKARAALEGK